MKEKENLVWNVYVSNWNGKSIELHNIFEHKSFWDSLCKLKKKWLKKDNFQFDEFMREVKNNLFYYYWGKCEWEVVITDWPPRIDGEELDRLNTEREKGKGKGYTCFYEPVNPGVAKKVDVYEQVINNWHAFAEYLRNNYKLIKKSK